MFWKINKAVCNLRFSWLGPARISHLPHFLHCYGLLFTTQTTRCASNLGGQILLLSILLHRNSYKKCCKKWIFLTAFWRRALCSKRHQVTWRPFSIYGSGAVTFKCKCDTSKTTWDMKTYWDVIVITEDTDLASKPGFRACSGGLLQASSSLSSIPRGSVKNRDKPKWCEHLSGIANTENESPLWEPALSLSQTYWLRFLKQC